MSCFWSGTDTETIRQLGDKGWCLATVFNKKEDSRSAYYQKGDDFIPEIFMDDMDTGTAVNNDGRSIGWEEEYNKKCTAKTFEPVLTKDDTMAMEDGHLASWWEEHNSKLDIIDAAQVATTLAISGLDRPQIIDLYDSFCEMMGDSPMSVVDLNYHFTRNLQGDVRGI